MDMVKIGGFLAELRKEHNLTQAELGEKLGVTNKTISRWETGNYMPPVDMLEELSTMYGLTINELLSGKKLSTEEYREMAESNIKETLKNSAFSLKEKQEFYKKKWLKEHIAIMVFIGICIVAVFVVGAILRKPLLGYAAILMLVLAHGWRNNTMMAYVERNAFLNTGTISQNSGLK
ncbi:MAG: helix-turn-helix domain-containing protein [Lachnospiraceae bacterium]|nr:helix-turn-helix domain-containing protein [Lachnospiraceae bacterium]